MRKKIACMFGIIFFGWILISYVNVVTHNMTDKQYASWNAIELFIESKKVAEAKRICLREQMPTTQVAGTETEQSEIAVSAKKLKKEKVKKPTKHYNKRNVVLLAKLIQVENGGAKHDETLYLTGAVVMKRVESDGYPDTIKEVIYQKGQYSTASRLDSVKPSTRALEIANDILVYGVDELPDNLVFQSLFSQGGKLYKKIDGEYFCLA